MARNVAMTPGVAMTSSVRVLGGMACIRMAVTRTVAAAMPKRPTVAVVHIRVKVAVLRIRKLVKVLVEPSLLVEFLNVGRCLALCMPRMLTGGILL
mmetsp:Transcript_114411/g.369688  ORF Transcript_114411/g.369688 Transcript_114411/m.369688 type:complete len:96 (+) Transcript_114411:438-725(+)